MANNETTTITSPPYGINQYGSFLLSQILGMTNPSATQGYLGKNGQFTSDVNQAQRNPAGQPVLDISGTPGGMLPYGDITGQTMSLQQLIQQNPGALAPSALDQKVAPMNPQQQMALDATTQQAMAGNPMLRAAENLNTATMMGYNLNPASNPYLQTTYDQAAQQMANAYRYGTAPSTDAQFAKAGSFGGSANQQTQQMNQFSFGNNLASLANQIYGGNYQQGIQNQMQAMNQVPSLSSQNFVDANQLLGVGGYLQSQNQAQLDAFRQNMQSRYQQPFTLLDLLGSGISQGIGTGAQSTQAYPNPNAQNSLGPILGGSLGLLGAGMNAYQNYNPGGGGYGNMGTPGGSPQAGFSTGMPYSGAGNYVSQSAQGPDITGMYFHP